MVLICISVIMIIVWHLFMKYFLALKSKAWRNRNLVSSKQLWGPGPSHYSRTKWLRRTASEHWWNSTPSPSNLQTSSITWAKKSFPLFKPAWFGFSVTCSLLNRVEKDTFPYLRQTRGIWRELCILAEVKTKNSIQRTQRTWNKEATASRRDIKE